jgi:Xaa-Pro aminopeptidase
MAQAPSDTLNRRHSALRAAMAARSLDALLVTSLPGILYLTNFSGSSAIVLLEATRLRFITDSRYVESLAVTRGTAWECPGLELEIVSSTYDGTLAETLARLSPGRIGFEAANLSVSRYEWLRTTLESAGSAHTLIAADGMIEAARLVKDSYELELLGEAGRRLSAVAADVFTVIARGRTEQEVAADIDWRIRRAGFERPAFETIVASGPRSALPHARPTERTLSEGDLVVLDFGGVYASYCVDLTRTVSIGPPSSRARAVHKAVLDAQTQAIAAVRPGASRFAIDAAARNALTAAGMGDAFGHGTGHGLGIEIHEDPRIVQRRPGVDTRNETVEPGMVFTIEPGAYFPGWGGVRIEDDVAVTEQGVERLTAVTTELLELS